MAHEQNPEHKGLETRSHQTQPRSIKKIIAEILADPRMENDRLRPYVVYLKGWHDRGMCWSKHDNPNLRYIWNVMFDPGNPNPGTFWQEM